MQIHMEPLFSLRRTLDCHGRPFYNRWNRSTRDLISAILQTFRISSWHQFNVDYLQIGHAILQDLPFFKIFIKVIIRCNVISSLECS
jgi:hypothetical protein